MLNVIIKRKILKIKLKKNEKRNDDDLFSLGIQAFPDSEMKETKGQIVCFIYVEVFRSLYI